MVRDYTIKLISQKFVTDENGNEIAEECKKSVFASLMSIGQNEFFQASQSGLKPQFKFIMNDFEYSGEILVEFNHKKYSVYRTYLAKSEKIELYLTEKVGVL